MNRLILSLLIGMLITSSVSMASLQQVEDHILTEHINLFFEKQPIISSSGNYVTITLDGTNTYMVTEGEPLLPLLIRTVELPRNVRITNVGFTTSQPIKTSLPTKIQPVLQSLPLSKQHLATDITPLENLDIYTSASAFPETTVDYTIRCGLNSHGEQTTFISFTIAPITYYPTEDTISFTPTLDINLSYELKDLTDLTITSNQSSMVIIAPETFSAPLQPLIAHKQAIGLPTTLKTTESIYSEFSGRDKPEQIKQFIKHTKETEGTTYILLVGGLNSLFNAKDKDDANQGSTDWYVPVRYTNNRGYDSDPYGTTSDLYYADLYAYDEETGTWVFDDWDSNENDIFAEYTFFGKDILDLSPDIYLGRLACRTIDEVTTVVQKIIDYESTPPTSKSWMQSMIGIGGRTFALEEGIPDGEYCCNSAFTHMDSLIDEEIQVYASNKDNGGLTPNAADITMALSEGAGFVLFSGHGSPMAWNTNWPYMDPGADHNWTGGFKLHDFFNINNNEKLPIIIIGGCHNGMFNISVLPALLAHYIDHNEERYWTGGYPTPECMSWRLVAKPDGGAIASTGCTGYGFGGDGAISRSSELEDNLFYLIGEEGINNLGDAHAGSISKFISENKVRKIEIHCIAVYQLFGDPSLKIGGYA